MSGAIKAGDMVMLARPMPCCGRITKYGLVGTVECATYEPQMRCGYCHASTPAHHDAVFVLGCWTPRSVWIRLDPPATSQTDKVTAPVEVVA